MLITLYNKNENVSNFHKRFLTTAFLKFVFQDFKWIWILYIQMKIA